MSKLRSGMLSAVLIAATTAAIGANAQSVQQRKNQQVAPAPAQAMQMKRVQKRPGQSHFIKRQHARFRCDAGQKKHLVIAGVEDNFSPSGSESAVKSARVAAQTNYPAWNAGTGAFFDGTRINRKIFSHLKFPPNVRAGQFMIGLNPLGAQLDTDGMAVGVLDNSYPTAKNVVGYSYATGSWRAVKGANLQKFGKNYVGNFNAMTMNNNNTLESYYQSSGDTVLDVYVQDDHSVDYVAASVCTGKDKKGMTWGLKNPIPESVNGVAHVGCTDVSGQKCDPYKGDTVCSTKLPILCHNPMKLQKPKHLTEGKWDKWSGGIIGTTQPMAAPNTLSQANQACRAEFGKGWRVAEHHDAYPGSSGWEFSAYGNVGTKSKRFWADIKNQPNGTCWSR